MIRSYILSVAAAAIICAVIRQFFQNSGAADRILRVLTGICMTLTVLQPLLNVQIGKISNIMSDFSYEANIAVQAGKENSYQAISEFIKEETESYILEKATQYDSNLQVRVLLNADEIPLPVAVELKGEVSPYAKQCIEKMIEEELGIPCEAQTWT